MALDGNPADFAPDFSALSWHQLIQDSRVSQSSRDQIILKVQKAGLDAGLIKLADFERLSVEDEIAKKLGDLERFLEALKFQHLSSALASYIKSQKEAVGLALASINNAISALAGGKGKEANAGKIERLKETQAGLREYKRNLDGYEIARKAARSSQDLNDIAQDAQRSESAFQKLRKKIRPSRGAEPDVRSAPDRTSSGQRAGEDDDDDEEEEEDRLRWGPDGNKPKSKRRPDEDGDSNPAPREP